MSRSISSNLIEKWARENLFLEIPLWMEKVFDESRRVITKLRCKPCTEYLKEIEHLPTFNLIPAGISQFFFTLNIFLLSNFCEKMNKNG